MSELASEFDSYGQKQSSTIESGHLLVTVNVCTKFKAMPIRT